MFSCFVQVNKKTIFGEKITVKGQFLLTFDGFLLYNSIAYRSITIIRRKRKCSKKHLAFYCH